MKVTSLAIKTPLVLAISLLSIQPSQAEVSIDLLVRSHRHPARVAVPAESSDSAVSVDATRPQQGYQDVSEHPGEQDLLSQLRPKMPKPSSNDDNFRLLIRL